MTGVLIKRRNLEHHVKIKAEMGYVSTGQEMPKMSANHWKWGKDLQQGLPRSPQREPTLPTPWFQTSELQNYEKVNFCSLNHWFVVPQ